MTQELNSFNSKVLKALQVVYLLESAWEQALVLMGFSNVPSKFLRFSVSSLLNSLCSLGAASLADCV